MYFDPLSTLIVTSLINGAKIISEKAGKDSSAKYYRDNLKMYNDMLNGTIRGIRERSDIGLCPEVTLDQIKQHICSIRNVCSAIKCGYGDVAIEQDNQEYIINLLEKCVEQCHECEVRYANNPKRVEEYRKKVQSYENILNKANELKEKQTRANHEEQKIQKKTDEISSIILIVSCIILIVVLIGTLSL